MSKPAILILMKYLVYILLTVALMACATVPERPPGYDRDAARCQALIDTELAGYSTRQHNAVAPQVFYGCMRKLGWEASGGRS